MGKRNRQNKKNEKNSVPAEVIDDERFSKVHHDPRFNQPKLNNNKIKVDTRFKSMLKKGMEFQSDAKVDKYGRKVKVDAKEELSKFYQLSESEDEDESNSEDEELDEEEKKELIFARSRGEVLLGSDSEEDEDEGESTEEEYDEEMEVEEQVEQVPRGDETCRFACMNMDWDNIRCKDLFKVFNSFKPEGGMIKSIAIYPSEFGKERIEHENKYGPPKDIFDIKEDEEDSNEEDDDEEDKDNIIQEDDGDEFNQENLRKYQLERLKYYYAVVECDSIKTAKKIYDSCDGDEYESTANFFDLRFIPDEMTFDDKPREITYEEDINYKSTPFVTKALTNSKVSLTWDQDEPERIQMLQKSFTEQEIDNLNFDAFLASSDDEPEEEKSKLRQKYLDLIKNGNSEDEEKNTDEDSDNDGEMEITFNPGLKEEKDEKSESEVEEMEEDQVQQETTVEKYLRKERERIAKKKAAKLEKKQIKIDESESQPKSKKELREEEEARKAELELVLMDEGEDNIQQHFDIKQIIKAEKQKSGNKKRKSKVDTELIQDNFKMDVTDDRFKQVHESHHFAIDPTHPQFKPTKAMKDILSERQRRLANKEDNIIEDKIQDQPIKNEAKEINNLISAVKRKAQQFKQTSKRNK
ncbi:hypothetical protein K502DRAFT_326412 [Neoconidiobolus thromboides FSU 785]|nr:hypothetical protein K502DRAFT_326412 [Neoconidiobolus thromboides FSU 785]